MPRWGLLVLLLLGGCVRTTDAAYFENPATGKMVAACGPLAGIDIAVTRARQFCVDAYKRDGWVPLQLSEAQR